MTAQIDKIHLGMEAYSADDQPLGKVKRIWWPDGRVEPEDPEQGGTFEVKAMTRHPPDAYFQIDRTLAPDWYVPFDAVSNIAESRVTLNLPLEQAARRAWQEKPV
jgi:hypothetical protein